MLTHLQTHACMQVPEALALLPQLSLLDLHGNCLTSLPVRLGECVHLTQLLVGNNTLTSLPPGVDALSGLTRLHVCGNPMAPHCVPPALRPALVGSISGEESLRGAGECQEAAAAKNEDGVTGWLQGDVATSEAAAGVPAGAYARRAPGGTQPAAPGAEAGSAMTAYRSSLALQEEAERRGRVVGGLVLEDAGSGWDRMFDVDAIQAVMRGPFHQGTVDAERRAAAEAQHRRHLCLQRESERAAARRSSRQNQDQDRSRQKALGQKQDASGPAEKAMAKLDDVLRQLLLARGGRGGVAMANAQAGVRGQQEGTEGKMPLESDRCGCV